MDIIQDLWPEFVELNADRIAEEIKTGFEINAVRGHIHFRYNPKNPSARQGADYGIITCNGLDAYGMPDSEVILVGSFYVDYSEPCIVYTIDDPLALI